MTDTNPTRVRYADYKAAFVEVLGDPSSPDTPEGAYSEYKRRSAMRIAEINDLGHGSVNPAKPLVNDFFCDVENVVKEVIPDLQVRQLFWNTYLMEEPDLFTHAELSRFEREIGKKFIARRITPVSRYFRSIRQRLPRG